MCTRALHEGYAIESPPDKEPVSCVAYMALVAARPAANERMHVMPATQLIKRFRTVFNDEIDDLCKGSVIDVSLV